MTGFVGTESPVDERIAQLDPEGARDVTEHLHSQGWTDGLPAVAATDDIVAGFLAETDRDPDDVVGRHPQLEREVTVRDVAVNAVMAGCLPEHLPLVLASWDALSSERAALGGGWQSTSGPGPLLIVNGPIRQRLGIASAGGALGPGFRANLSVPRAIGLTVRNGFGIRPRELEQATLGVPGRWNLCIGENEEESPWEPLSVELGHAPGDDVVSATLVRGFELVDNRSFTSAEDVLGDLVDTVQRSGALIGPHSPAGLLLNPEHARLFASAGMSKQDVREWITTRAGKTERELAAVGKGLNGRGDRTFEPDHFHRTIAGSAVGQFPIVVAGSSNAAMSLVFRVLGAWSGRAFPVR
ncbi:hypothetical protein DEU34_0243 [Microbacterium sp. AG1240]|uniref:hypothetical protein n=1 Tax=Microbacterium sp. AG1240 TaxID=2183992 RepID=UPI000F10BFF7|nr:hypothetical protein [Microbacterium sp. AG1240]RKT35740.1 hypothetical protein DEU34_0243 [Microbacterium sp. AG1240]